MLKFLRSKKVQKRIYIGLAVVIIPPFMLWGVKLREKGDITGNFLAMVDGQKISVTNYKDSYEAVKRQAELLYGGRINELASFFNFKGEAFDRILLLKYAKKEEVKVSDDEIVSWIAANPVFSGRGQFDDRLYKLYMNHLRVSPRAFEEEVRQTLMIGKIAEKLKSKISVTEDELKSLYIREYGQRDIQVAILPAGPAAAGPDLTDEELQKVYASLKSQLVSRGTVRFAYLFLPKDAPDLPKGILEEKDLSIEALGKKYNLPVRELEYPAKDKTTPENTLPKEILSQGFSAALNKDSDWLHLEGGSYKFKVTERKNGGPLTFGEAKPLIAEMLAKQKTLESAVKKLEELKKDLNSANFDQTLKNAGADVKTFEKHTAGTPLPGLENSRTAERKIADLAAGQISGAFAVRDGAAIVRVLEDAPFDLKKFETEKKKFKEAVLGRKTSEMMNQLIETLRKKLRVNLEVMNQLFPPESEQT